MKKKQQFTAEPQATDPMDPFRDPQTVPGGWDVSEFSNMRRTVAQNFSGQSENTEIASLMVFKHAENTI